MIEHHLLKDVDRVMEIFCSRKNGEDYLCHPVILYFKKHFHFKCDFYLL